MASGYLAELRLQRTAIVESSMDFRCPSIQAPMSWPNLGAERLREVDVLIIAAGRLREVNSRRDLFCAVQEIIANLLGSEHFAVFEKIAGKMQRTAFSGDKDRIPRTMNVIAQDIASRGEMLEFDMQPRISTPLVFGHAIVGLLVIYDLLPQKHTMSAVDSALLGLLQRFAGAGLVAFPAVSRSVRV
jgi:hypothetical protein